MGYRLIGEPDANGYYYTESARATDVDDVTSAPADVSEFLGRERR